MDPGNEDVFPIKNGDIPASYVSLPEGNMTSPLKMDGTGRRSGFLLGNPISID